MKHIAQKQSVVILKDTVSGGGNGFALGTLANVTALVFESTHGTGMLNAYLMKRVQASLTIVTADANDGPFVIGMARGGATVTEIKAAIEMAQLDRSRQQQADVRVVLHETLRMAHFPTSGNEANIQVIQESLGGGKGIPFDEGEGWQWFIYNLGPAQIAGAFVFLEASYWGAWLGN